MKKIENLIPDIYNLFKDGKGCKLSDEQTGEIISRCVDNIYEEINRAVTGESEQVKRLRLSNVGYPDRQLWYSCSDLTGEPLKDPDPIKFLYGHIIEELVLCLSELAGHEVTDRQKETTLGGIKGHIDAKVDHVLVDVKSASQFAFKKFKDNTLYSDDPFGYIDQLSSYATAEEMDRAGFLVLNKTSGELTWCELEELERPDTTDRILYLKDMIKNPTIPPRCYPDVPDGKSGNYRLGTNCFYCKYKHTCWSDANEGKGLRAFEYQKGIVYLTRVAKEPNVNETIISQS
jgi:hypothetical protein